MDDFKTFETSDSSLIDNSPIAKQQKMLVDSMRTFLLQFSSDTPNAARVAIANITVLRLFHQIQRIVRYTEMMDKLEDKLYASLDAAIDRVDEKSSSSWMMLLSIQEKLQKNMIESHKLLEPYIAKDMDKLYSVADTANIQDRQIHDDIILDRPSRDKLRASAGEILALLEENLQQ